MEKLIFILLLALLANIIYLITGRNKRQINKIPEGMAILCEPPGKRYVVYALGVFVVIFVGIFSVLYIMDGAPENARGMWLLCVAVAIFTLVVMLFAGNVMARECTYFNNDYIQIERAFRKPRRVRWQELRKMEGSFDNTFSLYLLDGTKILTVNAGMANYKLFCDVLKAQNPEAVKGHYRSKTYETPKKRILRYGTEYYIIAGMGILIMALYFGLLLPQEDFHLVEELRQSGPSQWFSLLFAPVCGVAGLLSLLVMSQTKVRYSEEKMVLKRPLRREQEIYWRTIKKIRLASTRKGGEETWKKLWIYTENAVYKLNLETLSYGKDDFVTEVEKMAEKYETTMLVL